MRSIDRYGKRRWLCGVGLLLCATGLLGGCTPLQTDLGAPLPPAIPVSQPAEESVNDHADFTGQTLAKESVVIIPRVTGYLKSAPFKEGAEVEAGATLFEIDPEPYQAQYDQANKQVELNDAQVKEAKADNARAKQLAQTPGAISKQDVDRYQAAEEEAIAAVQAAIASRKVYDINLGYCTVKSPIAGRVGRYYLTPGNLVNQDQTQLTTVVSLDPMYVYFDIDDNTRLRIVHEIEAGRIEPYQKSPIPVDIGLDDEDDRFPHHGVINFVNNQLNSGTGSITARGQVDNHPLARGVRIFAPGMFVRVRLPIGKPHKALLVIDRALGSDQGKKYLFVVDPKTNLVEQRRVETGELQENGLREIKSGLTKDEWVIVGAIQQVHPKMEIRPDRLKSMPVLNAAADVSPAGAGGKKETPAATPTNTGDTPSSGGAAAPSVPAADKTSVPPMAPAKDDDKPAEAPRR